MTARCVVLGDRRRVPLGAYVDAWKTVLSADPGQPFKRDLLDRWPSTATEILRQFRDGMEDRINRHDPRFGVGRKWSPDWQRAMTQAAHRLNTPRLVIDWLPKDLHHRFSYRLREVESNGVRDWQI